MEYSSINTPFSKKDFLYYSNENQKFLPANCETVDMSYYNSGNCETNDFTSIADVCLKSVLCDNRAKATTLLQNQNTTTSLARVDDNTVLYINNLQHLFNNSLCILLLGGIFLYDFTKK
jgi:hypothetical protein